MNKIYKIIWSKTKNCYVVASELAKSHTKSPSVGKIVQTTITGVIACVLSFGVPFNVFAAENISNLGTNNTVDKIDNPIVIGRNNVVSNTYNDAKISGYDGTIIIGNNASAQTSNGTGRYSTGDLYEVYVNSDGTVTVPSDFEKIAHAVGVGDNVKIGDMDTVAIGYYAKATSKSATALGHGANANAEESIALGTSNASGFMSSTIGWGASATNMGASAIGASSSAKGNFDIALGFDSTIGSNKGYNTAIGYKSSVNGYAKDSIALGTRSNVTKDNAIAIGIYSNVEGENSIALGERTATYGNQSVAIGSNSVAMDSDVVSFGRGPGDILPTEYDTTYRFSRSGDELSMMEMESVIANQMISPTEYKRRLIHVADGINDSDAATVGQLNAALSSGGASSFIGINSEGDSSVNFDGSGASGTDAISIGKKSTATGRMSNTLGWGSTASGDGSVSLGSASSSVGNYDTVVGVGSSILSSKGQNLALGSGNIVSGSNTARAVVIGNSSKATAPDSIALGTTSISNGMDSVAIGNSSIANGKSSLALGSDSYVSSNEENVVSFGHAAHIMTRPQDVTTYEFVEGEDGLELHPMTLHIDPNITNEEIPEFKRRLIHVADGINNSDAATVGQLNAAINGIGSGTVDISNIGENNTIERVVKPIVIGRNIEAKNQDYGQDMNLSDSDRTGLVAIGNDISASDLNSTYRNTRVTGDSIALPIDANRIAHDVAIGDEVKLADANAIGVGYKAQAMGYNAVAIGYNTQANRQNDIAIGNAAQTTGYHNIAMGNYAKATANTALAIGPVAKASGLGSISTGFNATSSGKESTAIGTKATSQADYSLSIGSYSRANGQASIALGQGSTSEANAIALGRHSNALANSIAIGSESVAKNENEISFGHSAGDSIEYAESTAILDEEYYYGNSMLTGHGEKTYDNDLNRRLTHIADGINHNDAATVGQLNEAIANLGSGGGSSANSIVYDDTNHGIITLDGTRGTKLTNLKAGSLSRTSTDAVTGSQLWTTNQNISGFAHDIEANRDTISTLNSSISNTLNSISAVTNLVNTVDENKANKSLENLNDSGRSVISSIANEAIQQYVQNNSGGLSLTNSANKPMLLMNQNNNNTLDNEIVLTSNDDLNNNIDTYSTTVIDDMMNTKADISYVDDNLSLKADKSYVDETLSLKADKDTVYTKDETYGKSEVYNKKEADALLDAKADKIELDAKANADASNIDVESWSSKLGVGQISEGNSGLVNGGTVYHALQNIQHNDLVTIENNAIRLGGNEKYNDIQTIDISNSEGNGRVITGVLVDVDNPNSAANVGYVNAVGENIVAGVNQGFKNVDTKMNKLGANAAALASLTPASVDGDEKWALSASVGNYNSETAGAVGLFYKPSDSVMVNVRGSFGNDENMIGGGVAVALDKGSTPGISKAQLVREVSTMKQEREIDRQVIAQQGREIAELKATVQHLIQQKNN